MKKSYKKIKTVLVQLLMGLFLGLFLGGFLVSMFELERFGIDIMIYFLIMAVVAYILQIIIHEGGHCLFGLLNGFEFISFRIGSYMWVKDHGKIKLSHKEFEKKPDNYEEKSSKKDFKKDGKKEFNKKPHTNNVNSESKTIAQMKDDGFKEYKKTEEVKEPVHEAKEEESKGLFSFFKKK